ncbi:GntR family transcriptional regulator [Arthrobacter sp. APC 3897]|uniref:GntR family transcriptional regulator n=1 Tax=Arthrobacter sp. APC 3897 TaxID=3035204 RepID=UPI0025B50D9F|nr:GntR family transcriptional regulator [Arthrobacter sp. APC 3897]MDN3480650.1 GntR family transcriptional regulator [Arthrobacter sp. APC 3897]
MNQKPKTVSRETIADQAEAHIRSMVADGTLQPGERLNEAAIAESILISRGPVREAIKRLAGEGYLTMQTHHGAFVKSYEPREIVELYELRSALEMFAVRLAVRKATDDQITQLSTALEAEQRRQESGASPSDTLTSGPYVAEFDFHQRLVELGGNELIRKELIEANLKLYLALRPTKRSEDRKHQSAVSHNHILKALREREEETCVRLIGEHLMDSLRNSLQVMNLESTLNDERTLS